MDKARNSVTARTPSGAVKLRKFIGGINIMRYTVTHNGYTVEYFNTIEEVEAYIGETLEQYKHLNPKEIYRGYASDNKATHPLHTLKSVVIWQYSTLYTEVFMIEQKA